MNTFLNHFYRFRHLIQSIPINRYKKTVTIYIFLLKSPIGFWKNEKQRKIKNNKRKLKKKEKLKMKKN